MLTNAAFNIAHGQIVLRMLLLLLPTLANAHARTTNRSIMTARRPTSILFEIFTTIDNAFQYSRNHPYHANERTIQQLRKTGTKKCHPQPMMMQWIWVHTVTASTMISLCSTNISKRPLKSNMKRGLDLTNAASACHAS